MSRTDLAPMTPAAVLDTSRASPELIRLFQAFFVAKSSRDADGESRAFSEASVAYGDVAMGWLVTGHDERVAALKHAVSRYGDGRSYQTMVMGELRDGAGRHQHAGNRRQRASHAQHRRFRSYKIVRWVDCWDSLSFDAAALAQKRTPDEQFPDEYFEREVGVCAARSIVDVATRLQAAWFEGDAETAAALFDDDAAVEDMAARVQVIGRRAITRYFERLLPTAPFGRGVRMRHIVGGVGGGGLAWIGEGPDGPVSGVTALSLSRADKVVRATTVYDSRLLTPEPRRNLVNLSTSS